MGAVETNIDDVYKKAFGVSFADMSPEDRKTADRAIAALHTYPHARTAEQNKLLSTIDLKDPNVLRGLGIYASYRAGSVPDESGAVSDFVRRRAIDAGVPVQALENVVKNREEQFKQWGQGVINRFAYLAPKKDDAQKADQSSMKVEDKPKPNTTKPMTNPVAQQQAAPPPAAPAATDPEGAPAPVQAQAPAQEAAQPVEPVQPTTQPELQPPTGPTNWRKQVLVNGQYVEVP